MKMKMLAALAIVFATAAPPAAAQNGALGAARDLYASARYDEALALLNGIKPAASAERKAVEQYRSLCLLALGRDTEAEGAIAVVIKADPFYEPTEASPRVRAAFTDVRQRLLPDIAASRYSLAKTAYDRKDYPAAEQYFRELIALLDDEDMGGRLPDLRTLAVGFLELSEKAATPSPEAKSAPPPPTQEPAALEPVANRIYVAEDVGVTPPVPVTQDVPRVPSSILPHSRDRGLLEIVVDEQGRVVNMTIRVSVHPIYDSQLLLAARDWRYQPARVNGQPVKFRKLIQIAVTKR